MYLAHKPIHYRGRKRTARTRDSRRAAREHCAHMRRGSICAMPSTRVSVDSMSNRLLDDIPVLEHSDLRKTKE
jgi:hypothetical protein